MAKPITGTYPVYFDNYINQVNENDLLAAFTNQADTVAHFFDRISEEKSGYAYAPGKWTLKEVLQHIIDAERIFSYRALSFSRKETASIPGFDENSYADNSYANERSWKDLVDEMKLVRASTEILFKSFTTDMLNHPGTANGKPVTAHAIGFILIGHLYHHKKVILERYLS